MVAPTLTVSILMSSPVQRLLRVSTARHAIYTTLQTQEHVTNTGGEGKLALHHICPAIAEELLQHEESHPKN